MPNDNSKHNTQLVMEENKKRMLAFELERPNEIKLTFNEWVKKQLTVEEVEERLNKRKTISEKQKESDSRFAKREIARGTKW